MSINRKLRGAILACALTMAVAAAPTDRLCAETIPVPWSTTSFDVSGHSQAGYVDSASGTLPKPFTVTHDDPDSASGQSLPVPGTGDVTTTVTRSGTGYYDTADTELGRVSGDPAGAISMRVEADAYADMSSTRYYKTEAAVASAEATFVGEFTSLGTLLDFDFDGRYDRSNLGNQSVGIVPETGWFDIYHEHNVKVQVKVEDLNASSTLFDEAVFSKYSTWRPLTENDVTFADSRSVDLSGTSGHTLAVTVTTTASVQDFVKNENFSDPYKTISGFASSKASLDFLNITFATQIPEPSTFALAAIGLLGLALCARRRKR